VLREVAGVIDQWRVDGDAPGPAALEEQVLVLQLLGLLIADVEVAQPGRDLPQLFPELGQDLSARCSWFTVRRRA
jgi:hypothetical protein